MQFANARHVHMSVSTTVCASFLLVSWILPEVYSLEVHEGHQAQHILSLSRRQKEKRRLAAKRGGSLSVEIDPHGAHQVLTTPLEDMSSEYTGLVGVGTSASGGPQFEARVVFDTGSTNLWVASVLCKAYPCDEQHTSYDPASSVTSEEYLEGASRDIDIMFGTGELKGASNFLGATLRTFTAKSTERYAQGVAELMGCLDEQVLQKPRICWTFETLQAHLAQERRRKSELVLARRLESLRAVSQAQASLGRFLDRRTSSVQDASCAASDAQGRLNRLQEQSRTVRVNALKRAQAQVADAEQRALQDARARHLLLDRREAELEKVIKLTGSLQSMSKATSDNLAKISRTLQAAETQASEVLEEKSYIEERKVQLEAREAALPVMERAWKEVSAKARRESTKGRELLAMATEHLSKQLLKEMGPAAQDQRFMQRLQQTIRLVRSRDGRDGAPPAPPPTQRKSARRKVPSPASPQSRPESRTSAESPVDEVPGAPPPTQRKSARREVPSPASPQSRPESRASESMGDEVPGAPPPTQRKSARRKVPSPASPQSRPESRASAESMVDEAAEASPKEEISVESPQKEVFVRQASELSQEDGPVLKKVQVAEPKKVVRSITAPPRRLNRWPQAAPHGVPTAAGAVGTSQSRVLVQTIPSARIAESSPLHRQEAARQISQPFTPEPMRYISVREAERSPVRGSPVAPVTVAAGAAGATGTATSPLRSVVTTEAPSTPQMPRRPQQFPYSPQAFSPASLQTMPGPMVTTMSSAR
eukprot:s515_g18.t1